MDKSLTHFINQASRNSNLYSVVTDLKNTMTFKDWRLITDNTTPLVKKNIGWFIGNPLPVSYAELSNINATIPAKDFDTEVDWLFLTLRRYYSEINTFLQFLATSP